MVRIEPVEEVSAELVDALQRFVPQLTNRAGPPTAGELRTIVESPATKLLVARDEEGSIVGSLTLALFRIPTGVRAWIEDVVVDESARGQGVGEALSREGIRLARAAGAQGVELTSHPSRKAANRLYQRLGFERRETNVYRYLL